MSLCLHVRQNRLGGYADPIVFFYVWISVSNTIFFQTLGFKKKNQFVLQYFVDAFQICPVYTFEFEFRRSVGISVLAKKYGSRVAASSEKSTRRTFDICIFFFKLCQYLIDKFTTSVCLRHFLRLTACIMCATNMPCRGIECTTVGQNTHSTSRFFFFSVTASADRVILFLFFFFHFSTSFSSFLW